MMTQSSIANPLSSDVIQIAGCGIAASLLALRALQLGFLPILLSAPTTRPVPGVEMLPASASAMLEALELGDVFARIDPGLAEGFSRQLVNGEVEVVAGRLLHLDRLKLRAALLREAVRRGARVQEYERMPPLCATLFCIDATGQRAIWSKPVQRVGRDIADIFIARTDGQLVKGRIALLGPRWAYVAADRAMATIGIVGPPGRCRYELDDEIRQALCLSPDLHFGFQGRRPAFLQWSTPVAGWRLSIGDAAVHHSPIGGRGISFVLGSIFAAVSVLATWRDFPRDAELARSYYAEFVAAEVRRHVAFLSGAEDDHPISPIPSTVSWRGASIATGLVENDRIVPGVAFRSINGTQVRWAGGFDLEVLRRLSEQGVASELLLGQLKHEGLTSEDAQQLVEWAWRKGFLAAANTSDAP